MNSPYRGEEIAFATIHGKERAAERPFARLLGATIVTPSGVNTDLLGTFTGEISRRGTMVDAARSKALLAIARTGSPFGLGSEGSFGPHPTLPFIAAGTELLLFVDRRCGIEILESLITHRTNYGSNVGRSLSDFDSFLTSVRFPSHAVVVSPNEPASGTCIVAKGVTSLDCFRDALLEAGRLSQDGFARATTDMRAHLNPTRMAVIRALAAQLARRLATRCPSCGRPGFGHRRLRTGLPCAHCGEPTQCRVATDLVCPHCAFSIEVDRMPQSSSADPQYCQHCNP